MDLDQQIQELYENAPDDGVTPAAVQAIAPALKLVAEQLKHPQYHILQTLDGRWVMVTLNQQKQPNTQRNVVYAFSTLKDALRSPATKDPQVIAMPLSIIPILFQMVAMTSIDGIVFFENPGDLNKGSEITRESIQQLIQAQLHPPQQPAPSLPPDIA